MANVSVFAVLSAVGTTFTRMNVQRAVQKVNNTGMLGRYLGVPYKRRRDIERQFSSVLQQVKGFIDYFMDHDPLASWRSVIVAVDCTGEREAADNIRHLAEPITGEDLIPRPTLLLTIPLTAHE